MANKEFLMTSIKTIKPLALALMLTALPGAARPAPRRAASRAALRGWESRAARRPPSAPPFSVSCPEPSLSETARPIGFVSGR